MSFPGTEPLLTDRFERAAAYAIALHRLDRRKGTSVPYVAHLFGVCATVLENGGTETAAIAALLHDAAEDHGGREQLAQIARRFGDDVAQIVEDCSDSLVDTSTRDKEPWLERKQKYLALLAARAGEPSHFPSLLVSAADKLHNVRSIVADIGRVGDAVYARFKGGKWGTLWNYRALADIYCDAAWRDDKTIARELSELIEGLAPGKSAAELLRAYQTSQCPNA